MIEAIIGLIMCLIAIAIGVNYIIRWFENDN
jgi:hypothetical protein